MRLAFTVNPIAGGFSPKDMDSMGGSEEGLVHLARALAARGHQVRVGWDQPATVEDGPVSYMPYHALGRHYDACIYLTTAEMVQPDVAKASILWTYQARPVPWVPFSRIVPCSQFLSRYFASLHEGSESRLRVIPYGYDPDVLLAEPRPPREANLVIHTASPDRGLTTLLRVWPEVLAARPDARLHITYGWDLFRKCGGSEGIVREVELLMQHPGVTMGRLSYRMIHEAFNRAGVWAYYCTGGEYFCQNAVKAQMAGAVPVTHPWGAMHETVWSGLRASSPEGFRDALIEALDPVRQEQLRAEIAPLGRTWADVAEMWEGVIHEAIADPTPGVRATAVVQVPDVPGDLVPNHDAKVVAALQQAVPPWLAQVQSRHAWADPTLGIQCAPLPPDTVPDAVILGWALERMDAPVPDILAQFGLQAGQHVMVVCSLGPWKASERYRTWQRRDVNEVFGQQPGLGINVVPFDADGSALCLVTFQYAPDKLGQRDLVRVRSRIPARETLSVCYIAPPRQSDVVLWRSLGSVEHIADEVVIAINGTVEPDGGPSFCDVATLADEWARKTGIPVTIVPALSPRWCFECLDTHAVGQVPWGHRIAGFETPRNQSIAPARGDHCLWLDTDEVLLHGERLAKFLRPNVFNGLGLGQDHFSSDPPAAYKRDTPMRVFRLVRDGSTAGFFPYGEHAWPTFHSGFSARFCGLVHEHPGGPGGNSRVWGDNDPGTRNFGEGWGPVLMVPDVWIAHSGYLTEGMRRGRFCRNWPLMIADRQKYPQRRLGTFLWLRDLAQQLRYLLERSGNRMTPEAAQYANATLALYEEHFAAANEPYSADAMQYGTLAAQVLGRGFDVALQLQAKKPEVSGDDAVQFGFQGRVTNAKQLTKFMESQEGQFDRWEGKYL